MEPCCSGSYVGEDEIGCGGSNKVVVELASGAAAEGDVEITEDCGTP